MKETPNQKAARVGHCDVHWHWHSVPESEFRITSNTCRCDCEEETLPETAQNDQVYVVFSGTPVVFTEGGSTLGIRSALVAAEQCAATLAEETQQPHTIMMVPASAIDGAIVAVYEGVVIKSLPEVTSE